MLRPSLVPFQLKKGGKVTPWNTGEARGWIQSDVKPHRLVKLGWTLFSCLPKLDLLSFKNNTDGEPETKGRCAAHHRSRERKKRENTTKSKEAAEPVWQTCCDLPTQRTGSSRLSWGQCSQAATSKSLPVLAGAGAELKKCNVTVWRSRQ